MQSIQLSENKLLYRQLSKLHMETSEPGKG